MQKLVLKIVLFLSTLSFSMASHALDLMVQEATITRVASSNDGVTDNFFIEVSGGTGPCADRGIVFPRALAISEGFYNRMFAIAMMAYAEGSTRVRVMGATAGCYNATFIEFRD